MKRKTVGIVGGLLVSLGLVAAVAHACGGGRHDGMGMMDKDPIKMQEQMQKRMEEHKTSMFKSLNVTDAQKTKINAILESNKGAMNSSIQEMVAMHQEMQALREAKVARDDPKSVALHDKMQKFHEQKQAQRKAINEQIRTVLTPEQATKFDAYNSKQTQRMERGMNRMQSHGMGM